MPDAWVCYNYIPYIFVQAVTKMVTGCLRMMKSNHICIRRLNFFLVGYEKYGTQSIYEQPLSMYWALNMQVFIKFLKFLTSFFQNR